MHLGQRFGIAYHKYVKHNIAAQVTSSKPRFIVHVFVVGYAWNLSPKNAIKTKDCDPKIVTSTVCQKSTMVKKQNCVLSIMLSLALK